MRNNQVCTLTEKEIKERMSLPENSLGLYGHKDYELILTAFDIEHQVSHPLSLQEIQKLNDHIKNRKAFVLCSKKADAFFKQNHGQYKNLMEKSNRFENKKLHCITPIKDNTITIDDSSFPILDIPLEGEEFNDTELGILIGTSEI